MLAAKVSGHFKMCNRPVFRDSLAETNSLSLFRQDEFAVPRQSQAIDLAPMNDLNLFGSFENFFRAPDDGSGRERGRPQGNLSLLGYCWKRTIHGNTTGMEDWQVGWRRPCREPVPASEEAALLGGRSLQEFVAAEFHAEILELVG